MPAIASRIPALTQYGGAPIIDASGKSIQRPFNNLGGANPFPVSTSKNDPVTTELAWLGVSTSEAPATIKRRGKSTPLADAQREQISKLEGEQLHQILSRIIDRKGWQSLRDDNKRKSISRFRREIEQADRQGSHGCSRISPSLWHSAVRSIGEDDAQGLNAIGS
jgi:hypothetical protein